MGEAHSNRPSTLKLSLLGNSVPIPPRDEHPSFQTPRTARNYEEHLYRETKRQQQQALADRRQLKQQEANSRAMLYARYKPAIDMSIEGIMANEDLPPPRKAKLIQIEKNRLHRKVSLELERLSSSIATQWQLNVFHLVGG
ncbi:hypothetical protein CYMTET_22229 [Cymbomonas tetramitiformis]|uniref:Uncharacterized protein n=1 Tax=Cymbomonas tetramitiformis TaxID=36881 RepID=A0AAE0L270_9CHLO|nr:hypothetical protein CYMTET_22229 [Cymbomonas tetramitiformis]